MTLHEYSASLEAPKLVDYLNKEGAIFLNGQEVEESFLDRTYEWSTESGSTSELKQTDHLNGQVQEFTPPSHKALVDQYILEGILKKNRNLEELLSIERGDGSFEVRRTEYKVTIKNEQYVDSYCLAKKTGAGSVSYFQYNNNPKGILANRFLIVKIDDSTIPVITHNFYQFCFLVGSHLSGYLELMDMPEESSYYKKKSSCGRTSG
jgi:hypothetical protein